MLNFSYNQRNFWLVIASENDRYYTDSLMELTLEQYLWLSLRESFYKKVWYLSLPDRKTLTIRSFGDKADESVFLVSRKKKFFSKTPLEWFCEQSEQSGRQAFVMDKTSFRNLFVSGCPVSDYQNIAVILVLRPVIADFREMMADDYPLPEFYADYLRTQKNSDMFSDPGCFSLQSFTKENIQNMLLYLLFRDRQKSSSAGLTGYMTAYLCYYLNSKGAQWDDHLQLLGGYDPLKYLLCPLHKNIREIFENTLNWKKLTETAEYLKSLDSFSPDNAVKMYAQERKLSFKKDSLRLMLPALYSIQEKCINCDPMRCGITAEDIPDSIREWVIASYEKIYRLSMTIGMGEENPVMQEQLDRLLGQLYNISHENESRLQYERYFRYFISAGQCMEHLYEPDDAKAVTFTERIRRYLETAEKLFEHINDWDENKTQKAEDVLAKMDKCFCTGGDRKELDKLMNECDLLILSHQMTAGLVSGHQENMSQWKNIDHLPDTLADSPHKKWMTP